MHHFELVPGKVFIKIYNKEFNASTHQYIPKKYPVEEILKNISAVTEDLGAKSLAILNQVHGIKVVDADNIWAVGQEPEADAMISMKNLRALGVQTADCVPVLLASKNGKIIGAAHCGWRSAFGGVLEVLAQKMREKSDDKIVAVIGPSIQQKSYEVDQNFYNNFLEKSEAYNQFFKKHLSEKYLFDLPAFVKFLLKNLDIEVVKHFNDDTYSNPELYPSYRYAMHNNISGGYKGSILSTIYISK